MFLDPEKLAEATPAEILDAAARGHLGLDQRYLRALLDRPEESLKAAAAFARRDDTEDRVDLSDELAYLFRYWRAPEGVPVLLKYIKEHPQEVDDELMEALVEIGPPALEPLLDLYGQLGESDSGEVAFILATLGVQDERIRNLLVNRSHDPEDAKFLLAIYDSLKPREREPFDIWSLYPEKADPPLDLLDEDERAGLLAHPVAAVREAAAASFFNKPLTANEQKKLLSLARDDESPTVRARAWEALANMTEETEVVEAMLAALRNPQLAMDERKGLLVGLSPEADRNEVRNAIIALYGTPEGRAKALEAMWRSLHPSFRDYFGRHLEDPDLEVRRGAIWGIGYYAIKSELDRLRKLFDDEDLRTDALFAYALALPGEISRGRVRGLLARIEKDARGLTDVEEELVKAALDERLMLAGKEPVFSEEED